MKEFLEDGNRVLWTIWCLLGLFLVLSMCPRAFAADQAVLEDPQAQASQSAQTIPPLDSATDPESDEADTIASASNYKLENQKKDPFKAVIQPKPKQEPDLTKRLDVKIIPSATVKIEPPIPPLQIQVMGICGNDQGRWVLAIFENQPRVLAPDMVVEGKFKVMEILADRLVVFSFRDNLRHAFKIGGEVK